MNDYDAMNENQDVFDDGSLNDDQLMKKISEAPEFSPAARQQVEQTWQAIVRGIEAADARPAEIERPAVPVLSTPSWLDRLFPAAPVWSWQLAKVAALLAIGFGVAWFASGRGWLPGASGPDIAGVPDGSGAESVHPNRAWLASNDYTDRLEVLLLGVARGEPMRSEDVGSVVREVSRELLSDSRFYRRVAARNDDPSLANLLSRVEIILLVLATAPEGEEQEVMDSLREFIDESDLLSELRAVRASVPVLPRPLLITTSGS